jgi:hypothetical protein
MNAISREVVGTFHDVKTLEHAANALMSNGFDRAALSLVAPDDAVRKQFGSRLKNIEKLEDHPDTPRIAYMDQDDVAVGRGALISGLTYLGAVTGSAAVLASGGALLPAVAIGAAAAIGRRQHCQYRVKRSGQRAVRGHDVLYRSHPGRDARPAGLRQAAHCVGNCLFAQSRSCRPIERGHGAVSQQDDPAPAGDQQPSRTHPQARLPGHERADRGRRLWQCELDPHHGFPHSERHRRIGRFRTQRLCVDLHDPVAAKSGTFPPSSRRRATSIISPRTCRSCH